MNKTKRYLVFGAVTVVAVLMVSVHAVLLVNAQAVDPTPKTNMIQQDPRALQPESFSKHARLDASVASGVTVPMTVGRCYWDTSRDCYMCMHGDGGLMCVGRSSSGRPDAGPELWTLDPASGATRGYLRPTTVSTPPEGVWLGQHPDAGQNPEFSVRQPIDGGAQDGAAVKVEVPFRAVGGLDAGIADPVSGGTMASAGSSLSPYTGNAPASWSVSLSAAMSCDADTPATCSGYLGRRGSGCNSPGTTWWAVLGGSNEDNGCDGTTIIRDGVTGYGTTESISQTVDLTGAYTLTFAENFRAGRWGNGAGGDVLVDTRRLYVDSAVVWSDTAETAGGDNVGTTRTINLANAYHGNHVIKFEIAQDVNFFTAAGQSPAVPGTKYFHCNDGTWLTTCDVTLCPGYPTAYLSEAKCTSGAVGAAAAFCQRSDQVCNGWGGVPGSSNQPFSCRAFLASGAVACVQPPNWAISNVSVTGYASSPAAINFKAVDSKIVVVGAGANSGNIFAVAGEVAVEALGRSTGLLGGVVGRVRLGHGARVYVEEATAVLAEMRISRSAGGVDETTALEAKIIPDRDGGVPDGGFRSTVLEQAIKTTVEIDRPTTAAHGIRIQAPVIDSTGTLETWSGLTVEDASAAGATAAYGIRLLHAGESYNAGKWSFGTSTCGAPVLGSTAISGNGTYLEMFTGGACARVGTIYSIGPGTPGAASASSGLTFSANPITGTGTIAHQSSAVAAGSYGGAATGIPTFTVDALGHLTAASTVGLGVAGGGTGASTLTGILLGNGTSAFTGLTTSAGVFGAISDETGGTGVLVGSGSPTITTPTLRTSATVDTSTSTDDRITLSPATGGAARFTGTITSSDLTADRTWTFPNAPGTVAVSATAPISLSATGAISHDTTAVTPGSYTAANITVDARGHITAAANGVAGTVTGTGTSGYHAKWTSSTAIGNGLLYDSGTGLGVGTTTPASLIHVYSTANAGRGMMIDAQGTGNAQQASVDWLTLGDGATGLNNSATKGWTNFVRGNAFATAAQQNDMGWSYYSGTTLTANVLTLDSALGYVGMGTATPITPLDVRRAGAAFTGNAVIISEFLDDTANKGVLLGYDTSKQSSVIASASSSAASSIAFWTYSGSAWGERATLNAVGNLGLGTVSPTAYTGFVTLALSGTSGGVLDFQTGATRVFEFFNSSTLFHLFNFQTSADALTVSATSTITLPAYGAGILHSSSGGAITSSAVALASDVSGNLPVTNLNSGTSASSTTWWNGTGAWTTPTASAVGAIGGSIANTQVAVGNGTNTVAGSGNLIWDGTTVEIGAPPAVQGQLSIYGAPTTSGSGRWNVAIEDSTAMALGVGGGIAFSGRFTSSITTQSTFATIAGIKENGTSANTAGALTFSTQPAGGGTNAEAMRIASDGKVGIGTGASPSQILHVKSAAAIYPLFETTANGQIALEVKKSGGDWLVGVDVGANGGKDFFVYDNTSAKNRISITQSATAGVVTIGPGVQLGSPSGGDLGAGTLNASGVGTFGGLITATSGLTANGTVTVAAGFSQTGANTFSTGTAANSLNGDTTVAAGKNLALASGAGTFAQIFTGTTTTGASITAASLTTGKALSIASTNNSAASTTWSGVLFSPTNAQGTTAATMAGVDVQFTQGTAIAANTEYALRVAGKQNDSSSTDQTIAALVRIENDDTSTGNQITVTDGLSIAGANLTNGINLSGTFATNLITSSNFVVTQAGAITSGSIPAASVTSGAALTKTDDTNVTATLGGSPTTALLSAASITLGWTGQLSIARGGTGASSFAASRVPFMNTGNTALTSSTRWTYDAAHTMQLGDPIGRGSATLLDYIDVGGGVLYPGSYFATINPGAGAYGLVGVHQDNDVANGGVAGVTGFGIATHTSGSMPVIVGTVGIAVNGSGQLANVVAGLQGIASTTTGAATHLIGVLLNSPTTGGGAVAGAWGVYVNPITVGATDHNWSFYYEGSSAANSAAITGDGRAVFGGTLPTAAMGLDVQTGGARFASLTASRVVASDSGKALTSSFASSVLLNSLTDATGTGVSVFATAPTITTLTLSGTANTTTLAMTQAVGTTGSPKAVTLALGAHTGLTHAEAMDLDLTGASRTVTFAAGGGDYALQRTLRVAAPTYAATTNATTITDAVAAEFTAPIAGTNVTLTNRWSTRDVLTSVGTGTPGGVSIINTTAAAAGAQQYSPLLVISGNGWKTDATAASQQVDFAMQVRPVQGAAAPTEAIHFLSQIAGGGWTSRANLDATGNLTATTFTGALAGNATTATTAATVTTNANLTGPITSVGNATSIASQTGTGTKFVVDTSPVLVTPTLGVASATSLTTTGSGGLDLGPASASIPSLSDGGAWIGSTNSSGSAPFTAFGHLVLASRTNGTGRDIYFYTGSTLTKRVTIDSNGLTTFAGAVTVATASTVNLGDVAVSQATNVNTATTCSGASCVITLQTATTAARTCETGFTLTNTAIASTSSVTVSVSDYSGTWFTNGAPFVRYDTVAAGSVKLYLCNLDATNALNGTVKVHLHAN